MAYQTKDNTGSVFQNDKKEKDTHPDRTGQARIGGVDYWVSGWIKQDRNGKPYLSLAFKPKEEKRTTPDRASTAASQDYQPQNMRAAMDDEIPF
jgi:hypothetical protein